ncbi:hypothetical protein D3870_20150 [Noviherbaspirillum cavernae]|uniref:Fido domain-containing protein n=1 Tax=Noviherbaspirillum cavernae TaxID=2320862 RepID=A0A418WW12_9BURK|nr:hypothetical protein [Noviherbaspirillum cavernae]RJF96721.1 hypothetical protein D3870_20150 [Noviherbaspirillum cavernae]
MTIPRIGAAIAGASPQHHRENEVRPEIAAPVATSATTLMQTNATLSPPAKSQSTIELLKRFHNLNLSLPPANAQASPARQLKPYTPDLSENFRKLVKSEFETIAMSLKECFNAERETLERMSGLEANLPMAALIAAILKTAHDQDIGLEGEHLDAMFKDANRACQIAALKIGMTLPGEFKLAANTMPPLMKNFDQTPLKDIPEGQRWKMLGIDHCKIEVLKHWFAHNQTLKTHNIDVDHFLFGYIFDSEKSYLFGTTKAMLSAMRNAEDKTAYPDLAQLKELHVLATEQNPAIRSGEIFDGVKDGKFEADVSFNVRPGHTLTDDGMKELHSFFEGLRIGADEPDMIDITQSTSTYTTVSRGGISAEALERKAEEKFSAYRAEVEAAKEDANPQARADRCAKAAIDLCQWLERAHLFGDGNARICHLLLNQELARHGEPLAIFDDINKFDGHSRDELFKLLREDAQPRYLTLCARAS